MPPRNWSIEIKAKTWRIHLRAWWQWTQTWSGNTDERRYSQTNEKEATNCIKRLLSVHEAFPWDLWFDHSIQGKQSTISFIRRVCIYHGKRNWSKEAYYSLWRLQLWPKKRKSFYTNAQDKFQQIVREPTTYRGYCIDHVYHNLTDKEGEIVYKLHYIGYSDHEAVCIRMWNFSNNDNR